MFSLIGMRLVEILQIDLKHLDIYVLFAVVELLRTMVQGE